MAEIKIEKKKRSGPGSLRPPFASGNFVFSIFRNDTDDNAAEPVATTAVADNTNSVSNNAVDTYIAFVSTDTATMGLDHVFTHNALIKLIDATKATAANQNFDIQADLDKATEDANKITEDPMATTHAGYIKDATSKLSTAMQNMQQAKYPQLNAESQKVKDASNDISTADLTLDQKQTIKRFFNDAADLLKKMN